MKFAIFTCSVLKNSKLDVAKQQNKMEEGGRSIIDIREVRKFGITVVVLKKIFIAIGTRTGAMHTQWIQKEMTVKYDARYAARHCLRHEIRTFSRKEAARSDKRLWEEKRRKERGEEREGDKFRTAPLMISKHFDQLKEDFHYWITTEFKFYLKRARLILLLIHRNSYLNGTAHRSTSLAFTIILCKINRQVQWNQLAALSKNILRGNIFRFGDKIRLKDND